jgi:hypothetical protein
MEMEHRRKGEGDTGAGQWNNRDVGTLIMWKDRKEGGEHNNRTDKYK